MSKTYPPKITVLVVEDEALILWSTAQDLRDAGYEVLEAGNADEALEILTANPQISLLFTDVDMPGSMDGLKLSAAVASGWPPVKIIVTSGKTVLLPHQLPPEGRFMAKPYRSERVIAAMQDMLR